MHVRLSLSEITSLFGLTRYLDQTFAQRIGSAKVKSKSEVTYCTFVADDLAQLSPPCGCEKQPGFLQVKKTGKSWGILVVREKSGEISFCKSQGKWKIGATECQIFRVKIIKFGFRWGTAPDPAGGAYSTPPDLVAALNIINLKI